MRCSWSSPARQKRPSARGSEPPYLQPLDLIGPLGHSCSLLAIAERVTGKVSCPSVLPSVPLRCCIASIELYIPSTSIPPHGARSTACLKTEREYRWSPR